MPSDSSLSANPSAVTSTGDDTFTEGASRWAGLAAPWVDRANAGGPDSTPPTPASRARTITIRIGLTFEHLRAGGSVRGSAMVPVAADKSNPALPRESTRAWSSQENVRKGLHLRSHQVVHPPRDGIGLGSQVPFAGGRTTHHR